MRVTFESFNRNAAAAIETATERLAEMQRQVASGKRVERGSDDPAAAAAAIAERGRLAATDVYTASGDSAQSRLMVVDTVLSDLGQQLNAAQVSLAGARGSSVTAAQREARAQELEGLRDAPCQFALFTEPATAQGHGLGRQTMPATIEYSAVAAVTVLWLAARAEGIGMGWVSILEPVDVAKILDVPPDWTMVGYFCLGYPKAEAVTPTLETDGWEYRNDPSATIIRR